MTAKIQNRFELLPRITCSKEEACAMLGVGRNTDFSKVEKLKNIPIVAYGDDQQNPRYYIEDIKQAVINARRVN